MAVKPPLGAIFSRVLSRLWGDKEARILILGLDGAGKTTMLYRMQVSTSVSTLLKINQSNLKLRVF